MKFLRKLNSLFIILYTALCKCIHVSFFVYFLVSVHIQICVGFFFMNIFIYWPYYNHRFYFCFILFLYSEIIIKFFINFNLPIISACNLTKLSVLITVIIFFTCLQNVTLAKQSFLYLPEVGCCVYNYFLNEVVIDRLSSPFLDI